MLSAFVLYVLFSLSVDSLLLNLKKSCVPAQVAKGQCHVCVCNKDGMFKCQSTGCQTVVNPEKLSQGECQPLMTYQYEDLYCTCNYEGKWMSYNCRTYFQNITLDDSNIRNNLRANFTSHSQLKRRGNIPRIREGDSCVPGNVYKLSCNTCQCGPNNALICTKMLCLDKNIKNRIKNINNKRNKTIDHKKRNLRKSEIYKNLKKIPKIPSKDCVPGRLYRKGCQKCLCKDDMTVVCTKKCFLSSSKRITDNEILQFGNRPFWRFEKLLHMGERCEPGKMYTVLCNLCFCEEEGDLICTLKYCLYSKSYAQIQVHKLKGTQCTKDYVKDCAQCQCVNNTSVCTELGSCLSDMSGKQLSAGDIMKLTLDVTKDKCIPNETYKVHCNDCFCQPDGSLRCTQKTCLTYSQAKELDERKTYLEKYGL